MLDHLNCRLILFYFKHREVCVSNESNHNTQHNHLSAEVWDGEIIEQVK